MGEDCGTPFTCFWAVGAWSYRRGGVIIGVRIVALHIYVSGRWGHGVIGGWSYSRSEDCGTPFTCFWVGA